MSRGRQLGLAIALGVLLALLILTPAGSQLRGLVSDPGDTGTDDHSTGHPGSKNSATTPSKTGRRPPRPNPTAEETKELLRTTIIEEVHLVDLTLPQCVESINHLIEKAGVNRRNLHLVLSESARQSMRDRPDAPWHEVKLRNVPVATVLQYLIDVRGVWVQVGEGIVEMKLMSEPMDETPAQKLVRAKLNEITIPVIDFEDTTLEEAMDFLRSRSRELDTTTLDPKRKGFSFVIRKRRIEGSILDEELDAEDGFGSAETEPILTMQGVNIPLANALDEITRRADLQWTIDDSAITIYPAAPGIPLDRHHPMAPPPDPDDPFAP